MTHHHPHPPNCLMWGLRREKNAWTFQVAKDLFMTWCFYFLELFFCLISLIDVLLAFNVHVSSYTSCVHGCSFSHFLNEILFLKNSNYIHKNTKFTWKIISTFKGFGSWTCNELWKESTLFPEDWLHYWTKKWFPLDSLTPFSSTLRWHSLKVKGEIQTRNADLLKVCTYGSGG